MIIKPQKGGSINIKPKMGTKYLKHTIGLISLVCFALAIISYNPKDPSLNTITNYPTSNILGLLGSYTADFLLQCFGFGIIMLPLMTWHTLKGKLVSRLNAALWGFFIFSLTVLAATLPHNWNSGGMLGTVALALLKKIPQIGDYPALASIAIWLLLLGCLKFKTIHFHSKKTLQNVIDAPQEIRATQRSNKKHKPDVLELASNYIGLSMDLLSKPKKIHPDKDRSEELAAELERILEDFHIHGKITEITKGPVITLYELLPVAGTKSSRVIGLANDIARSMKVVSTRVATLPGKETIGIELPNKNRQLVSLREIIEKTQEQSKEFKLPIALGKNIRGDAEIAELANMPHLLMAGTTGSGKSVGLNAMIISLLYALEPQQCRFIMIDPKMLELAIYDGIPHLLTPVIIDAKKSINALNWAIGEMENRYRLMSQLAVRNICGYNQKISSGLEKGIELSRHIQSGFDETTQQPIFEEVPIAMNPMPFIVIVIDEMADLMLVSGKEFEIAVQRLTQMGRAAGIHIIAATQRPSVDVITGVIKANFPTRISFAVTSKFDSRTILGEQGAEQLLGKGDMLYMPSSSKIQRMHGPLVTDQEVQKVVEHLKQNGAPNYIEGVVQDREEAEPQTTTRETNKDQLYEEATQIILHDQKISISYIQRKLGIGYNKAANIVEKMEQEGLISKPDRVGRRQILKH